MMISISWRAVRIAAFLLCCIALGTSCMSEGPGGARVVGRFNDPLFETINATGQPVRGVVESVGQAEYTRIGCTGSTQQSSAIDGLSFFDEVEVFYDTLAKADVLFADLQGERVEYKNVLVLPATQRGALRQFAIVWDEAKEKYRAVEVDALPDGLQGTPWVYPQKSAASPRSGKNEQP